MDVLMHLQL